MLLIVIMAISSIIVFKNKKEDHKEEKIIEQVIDTAYKKDDVENTQMNNLQENNIKFSDEYNEYIDMVAEAACQEVEDVIQGAISDEELSKICAASKNVKDADVSDDYSKLTYGQDCYTPDRSNVKADGSIDTEINSKHESVDYGELFY